MDHLLDNPAWHALNSGNEGLSFGNERVKFFNPEVSPFVGFSQNTPEHFDELYETLPDNRFALFVATVPTEIPQPWRVLRMVPGFQMVWDETKSLTPEINTIIRLTDTHIPDMLELTELTKPGPFARRTIDFSHYEGIFEEDQLVALTGQRLHPYNYTEVSAVCTRPGFTGKGYARQLIASQVNRMLANGKKPFLHVAGDNERAIQVYESLGFVKRSEVSFTAMIKK